MLVAFGAGFCLVLLGGICSILGIVEAGRRRVSPVPAGVGLVLNAIPPFAALLLDLLARRSP